MRALRLCLVGLMALCHSCTADTSSPAAPATASSRAEAAAEFATSAVNARMLGELLFERYQEATPADTARDRTAVSTATARIDDGCGFAHEVVLIPSSQVPFPTQQIQLKDRSGLLTYVIGKASDNQTVVLGPHYRFELDPDGKSVRSMAQSTPGCMSRSRSELSGSPIDMRPAKAPTEIDVFLSLVHKTKLRLRTASGIWEADNGSLDLVAADPAYRPATNALIDCRLPDGAKITTTATACQGSGGTILN